MNSNFYEYINISNVINKLNLKKTNQIGNNIYVVCPFCQNGNEKNGYLKANIINNLYICNNCQTSGTSVELYASMKYITTKEAYIRLSREAPILDNIPYIFNNPIKDENYRDLVYNEFLDIQTLSNKHKEKLINMGFSEKYILENKFKTIECSKKRIGEICKELENKGYKLDGLPGFYQDNNFKWTYKSHRGIFIPVTLYNKIQGLRILLDEPYYLDTENIWFSSNNEYNGTKASNWPMILKESTLNWIDIYNCTTESIIIATDMILAHKLFNNTGQTVIGIPNNINKELILNIVKKMNVSKVILYVDKYTILHTDVSICKNLINVLEEQKISIDFRIAVTENNIGNDLTSSENVIKIA